MTTEPRINPPATSLRTSSTLPPTSRKAPAAAITAATGLSAAFATASPILIACDTEPRTVASRACAAVSGKSAACPNPPNSAAAARSRRSTQSPEIARKTTTLPRSSVITAGHGEIPASSMVTCETRGKARPMPSASTTGSPIRAAQATGSRPLPPPISPAMSATTVRPV